MCNPRQVWDRTSKRRLLYHRQLAAAYLGRPLELGEIVHHRDGDPSNNARDNLLVLPNQRYHAHIEYLLRCERQGQIMLFPEFLHPVRRQVPGSLFENLLLDPRIPGRFS